VHLCIVGIAPKRAQRPAALAVVRAVWCLLLVVSLLPFLQPSAMARQPSFRNMTVEEARHLLEAEPSLFVLDVRSRDEYISGHIPGAINIPYTEIQTRRGKLPADTGTPLLAYCRSGFRSTIASRTLVSLGFENVTNMIGGILAWKRKGLPVVKGEEPGEKEIREHLLFFLGTGVLAFAGKGWRKRVRRSLR